MSAGKPSGGSKFYTEPGLDGKTTEVVEDIVVKALDGLIREQRSAKARLAKGTEVGVSIDGDAETRVTSRAFQGVRLDLFAIDENRVAAVPIQYR
jgi:hypothetical protein